MITTSKLTATIPNDMMDRLKTEAEETDRPLSRVLTRILQNHFASQEAVGE